MAELLQDTAPAVPQDAFGRLLWRCAKWWALGGAAVLVLICLLSTVSIIGRALFSVPVKGDVELVQMGCVWAVSSFLPYAQLNKAHVIVDFFTLKAPRSVRRFLDVAAVLLMAAVALVLMWRTYFGVLGTYRSGASTMILALPEWWVHLAVPPSFALLAVCAAYTARQMASAYPKQ